MKLQTVVANKLGHFQLPVGTTFTIPIFDNEGNEIDNATVILTQPLTVTPSSPSTVVRVAWERTKVSDYLFPIT